MRREHGPSEGVFLPATDLFALMAISMLVFISMLDTETEQLEGVDIPVAARGEPDPDLTEDRVLEGRLYEERDGCFVEVLAPVKHKQRGIPVACLPRSWGGSGPRSRSLQTLAKRVATERRGAPRFLIRCPGSGRRAMTHCEILQFTLIEHGFQPVLLDE